MVAEFPETSIPCCLLPTRKVGELIELNSAENPRTLQDDLLQRSGKLLNTRLLYPKKPQPEYHRDLNIGW